MSGEHVGSVQAKCPNADQHLSFSGGGYRELLQLEDGRRASFAYHNRLHHSLVTHDGVYAFPFAACVDLIIIVYFCVAFLTSIS